MKIPINDIHFIIGMFWFICVPMIIGVLITLNIQPFRKYYEDGKIDTNLKTILFGILLMLYNIIGILGGVMICNMVVQSIVLVIMSIFGVKTH